MKVAIIDLGSNSFHLVIFDIKSRKKIIPLRRHSYINSLGSSLSIDNRILPDVIAHSVAKVEALCRYAHRNKAGVVRIFGTSIFRRAVNSIQLVDAIFKKTGYVVDVLSEEDEARIIFEAAKREIPNTATKIITDWNMSVNTTP